MDQASIDACLQDLHLPAIRYFQTIDSTNDEAWRWVDTSAPHAALVVADEQTAGRGRFKRRWVTAAGSGLAFSLVLRPPVISAQHVSRLAGLAALSICQSLQASLNLPALVKWPNDVLVNQRKAAGILAETRWEGPQLVAAVVGIGINIAPESIDLRLLPLAGMNFPATCIEEAVGHRVDRWELLHAILGSFIQLLPGISSPRFIDEWQRWLAYRGQWVELVLDHPAPSTSLPPVALAGKLVGLNLDGSLQLLTANNEMMTVQVGELQLRPAGQPEDMEKG